jgi:hypothetical protein
MKDSFGFDDEDCDGAVDKEIDGLACDDDVNEI